MDGVHNQRYRRLSFADDDAEARRLMDTQALLEDDVLDEREPLNPNNNTQGSHLTFRLRASAIRALALLCVCSLSIGSHYASYILGPLKSRLSREMGTSNTEFSLLLAALASSGTWTPLVGGYMTQRLGTATSSIIATGAVFLGQLLLLVGQSYGEVRLMTLGMFVFGLGISPLAVVQETIIVQFFNSHSLGISLALGLVAGKGASFVAARTSYPLSQISPSAPFYVATAATAFSFTINIIYILISKWLIRGAGSGYDALEVQHDHPSFTNYSEAEALQKVLEKRRVNIKDIFKLGDVFWAYIGLNVVCGCIWSPFTHLAPNILERRFSLSESDASKQASYLLGGSIFLYPLCGFLVDKAKRRPIVIQLLTSASILTLSCYFWLALPPQVTKTAWPAIVPFGTALGFAPLLLVVIVPKLVPLAYVSTTLGMHKSLEHTGVTIFQTFTGLWLDLKKGKDRNHSEDPSTNDIRLQWLINTFIFFNILQLVGIGGLAYLDWRKKRAATVADTGASDEDESLSQSRRPLLRPPSEPQNDQTYARPPPSRHNTLAPSEQVSDAEAKRGKVFAIMCFVAVLFAWVSFLVTSFIKIRSKQEREGH